VLLAFGLVILELSAMEQRYQAVLEVAAGVPVVEVAERFGVSRQAVHRWVGRYRAEGLEGLADRSHRPKSSPWQVSAEVEALVCEMRRMHPRWGRAGCAQSWPGAGLTRCRTVRRSTGSWSGSAWSR
jgi:transposase